MSQEEFTNILEWIVLATGIPALLNAVIFALFLREVERKLSKLICGFAFVVFLAMGILRIITAYNFDNQNMRIYNGVLVAIGGFVSCIAFAWAYWRRLQEVKPSDKLERMKTEAMIIPSSIDKLSPDGLSDLVYKLHPSDVPKLAKMLSKIRIN